MQPSAIVTSSVTKVLDQHSDLTRIYVRPHWLDVGRTDHWVATLRAAQVRVSLQVGHDTVVAEHMPAAHLPRGHWPLPTHTAGHEVSLDPLPQVTFTPDLVTFDPSHHCVLGPLEVDERQQEEQELRKTMPQKLSCHELKSNLSQALPPRQQCPHPQHPLHQGQKHSLAQEHHQVEHSSHLEDCLSLL